MSLKAVGRRAIAAACFVLVAPARGWPAQPSLTRFEFSEVHMGTRFRIVLYAPDSSTATRASRAAFDRIKGLDDTMSDYKPSSELMLLSQQAGGPPVKLSEDLFRVLAKAQEIAGESDGAFDITVAPLVHLWRRARRQHELPDRESLAQALALVGYRNLRLDPQARTAQLTMKGMLLDAGGIAKGDASDQALLVLKQFGIKRALVAGGGDIAVGAPPPGREGWLIGIPPLEQPEDAIRESKIQNKSKIRSAPRPRMISLHDAGVSTSGEAEQHTQIGGVRYSHIINPKTGLALTGRSSVTVIAPNDITADALANAVSVLGPERGLKLIESTPDAAALCVVMTDQGPMTYQARFPQLK